MGTLKGATHTCISPLAPYAIDPKCLHDSLGNHTSQEFLERNQLTLLLLLRYDRAIWLAPSVSYGSQCHSMRIL
jgi:hypothetical protein